MEAEILNFCKVRLAFGVVGKGDDGTDYCIFLDLRVGVAQHIEAGPVLSPKYFIFHLHPNPRKKCLSDRAVVFVDESPIDSTVVDERMDVLAQQLLFTFVSEQ
ncbi:hypothetical protein SDC9_97702 [bioreactor metagenome]|uniref:Uncharacterized protein n=1 Tax=bioreactor metagenome TaxID=1076179 RepID=A0A645ADC4_9ZZZZ